VTGRLETPEQAAARLASEALSAPEQAQLWQRIASTAGAARARRRRRKLALAIAVPASAVAIGFWLLPPRHAASPRAPLATADPCMLDARARQLQLPQRCAETAVRIDGDEWLLAAGARIVRGDGEPRVIEGRVRFRVRPRAQAPFRVRVSHGEVQVIGTVFRIEQESARGSVSVSEGVIEFVWHDGVRARVAAGQTLHWPRSASTGAGPAPTVDAGIHDAGARGVRRGPDLDHVMERLLQLKSQKRHGDAIALLRATLAGRALTKVQRERISYELGLSLEAGGEPSCTHWRRHVEQFGAERRKAALAERVERCRQP